MNSTPKTEPVFLAFERADSSKIAFQNGQTFAWTPLAVSSLRALNKPFVTTSDLQELGKYWGEDHVKLICNFQDWCSQIDSILQAMIPEVAKHNLRPFVFKLLAMRKAFYQYFNEYIKLKLVCDFYARPVRYYRGPGTEFIDEILNLKGISLDVKALNPEYTPQKVNVTIGHWYQDHLIPKQIAKFIVRDKKTKRTFDFARSISGQALAFKNSLKPVLVLNRGYDSDAIMQRFSAETGRRIIYWEDMPLVRSKPLSVDHTLVLERIEKTMINHSWTSRDGVNFFSCFKPVIQSVIVNDLTRMIQVAESFLKFQKRFDFAAIFAAFGSTENEVIFDLCDQLQIPSFHNLHGATIGVYEHFAPMPAIATNYKHPQNSYFLLYSDIVKNYCDRVKKDVPTYKVENVAVGTPQFDRLREKCK